MITLDIVIRDYGTLTYETEELIILDNYLKFVTSDNVGVGIPISSIVFWTVRDKSEEEETKKHIGEKSQE